MPPPLTSVTFPSRQQAYAYRNPASPTSEDDVALQNQEQPSDLVYSELEISEDEFYERSSNVDEGVIDSNGGTASLQQHLPESFCPFSQTISWRTLYDSHGLAVPANIYAKFTRAYLVDSSGVQHHHILYRRNYFAVAVNYTLRPPTEHVDPALYMYDDNSRCLVKTVSLRMRAVKDHEHGEEVILSIFTSKRGPPIYPPPLLEQKMQPNMRDYADVYSESTGYGRDLLHRPIHYTFTRLQFRKATENNGARRRGQSYYRIVVEMYASVVWPSGQEEQVKVASTISGLLLVRGRCPNSFEPYDPTNKKRKPAKVRQGRPNVKKARPKDVDKKKGPSLKQRRASMSTTSAATQQARRLSSTTDCSFVPDLSSGSSSLASPNIVGLTESDAPMGVPIERISRHLPPPILIEAQQQAPWPPLKVYSAQDNPFVPFDNAFFANPDPGYGASSSYGASPNHAVNAYSHSGPSHIAQNWLHFNMPSYAVPAPNAAPNMQTYDGANAALPFADLYMYASGSLGDDGQPTLQRRA